MSDGGSGAANDGPQPAGQQRLDKWLWFARFVKTRTLAAELVASGKVRLNRVRAEKPAQTVHAGDVLTIVVNRHVRLVRVLGIAERRGPASAAQALYEELTAEGDSIKPRSPSSTAADARQPNPAVPHSPPGGGRPTKKQRRDLNRLSGKLR